MQQARERADRRAGNAARNVKNAGLPKIVAGKMKRDAQESAGRSDEVHAARVDDARARLDDAERALRDDAGDRAGPARHRGARRTHRVRRRGSADEPRRPAAVRKRHRPDRPRTRTHRAHRAQRRRQVDAAADHRRRTAAGDGAVQRADGRVAYLSQRLDLLDPDRTVAESLAAFAPSLTETRRMHLLAQFLFRGDRIHLPVAALSGGERLRATLACVLYAEPAPQLLLLDEPTNNLDLVSVGQLESALNAYEGPLWW